jgi:hypothetical protein
MANKIWHANDLNAADWFIEGVKPLRQTWAKEVIPAAGSAGFLRLPEQIKRILRLDKPDLIATIEKNGRDEPVVSIEITSTTPHGQHGKQRFARLVAAAEAGVPCLYITPERKEAVVRNRPHIYNLTESVYYALERINSLNDAPAFIYCYSDATGKLLMDSRFPQQPSLSHPDIQNAFKSIVSAIKRLSTNVSLQAWRRDPWVSSELRRISAKASGHVESVSDYKTLEGIQTSDLESYLLSNTSMPRTWVKKTLDESPPRLFARDRSLIFKPNGRLFEKAGDPYCGMMAFFDYVFCRTGSGVEDRHTNLIYMPLKHSRPRDISSHFAAKGYHTFYKRDSAFRHKHVDKVAQQFQISHELQYGGVFTMIKPLRIYGYLADLIVFNDAMLVF